MKKLIITFFLVFSIFPIFSNAQNFDSKGNVILDYGGLVKCDGVTSPTKDEPERQKECNFQALISMANSIIKWVFRLTIPIFIALMAYGGFLYMTPNPSNRATANKMLWAALWGFVIMLCAWFIVTTLLDWVLDNSFKGVANSLLEQNK